MKVLFVHERFGDLGGAESTIRRLAEGLRAREVELAFSYGSLTPQGKERFVELFGRRWCWRRDGLRAAFDWGPDVVFVHKLDDLALLRHLVDSRLPLVRMVHDHDIYCQRRHRYLPWSREICTRRAGWVCGALCGVVRSDGPLPIRLAWPGAKLEEIELCRRFDHHITVSDYLKRELVLHGFDPEHITTAWPAVRPVSEDERTTYREPLLVYAGQILRGKGVDVLIESLTQLKTPGWRCSILGDGSYLDHCRRLVAALGLADRVRLHGWVPQQELHRTLRHARLGVVPSVWPEPLGAVGIEMFMHGLPVVAFDVGGIGEWLHDGDNGFLVPVFQRAALAERIDQLLNDPELARRMGERGRTQAETWCNEARYFDEVLSILQRSSARSSAPRAKVTLQVV